jgi:hypothetical protein
MKLGKTVGITEKSLKHLYTIGGAVSVLLIMYYATGIYKNYLQIRDIKKDSNPEILKKD